MTGVLMERGGETQGGHVQREKRREVRVGDGMSLE